MIKRIISAFLIVLLLCVNVGCARKTKPVFNIKHESVTSIDFKRSTYAQNGNLSLKCVQKTVDDTDDIEKLLTFVESLKLVKHAPIEVPSEKIQYVMVLNGVKDHKLVFMDEYVVYDSTAYTYKNLSQKSEVAEKYNLLNYPETESDLI